MQMSLSQIKSFEEYLMPFLSPLLGTVIGIKPLDKAECEKELLRSTTSNGVELKMLFVIFFIQIDANRWPVEEVKNEKMHRESS